METENPKKEKAKRARARRRTQGTECVWPAGVQQQLGVGAVTRWRMERDGRLPPRDFYIGGVAVGWHPETLDAASRRAS